MKRMTCPAVRSLDSSIGNQSDDFVKTFRLPVSRAQTCGCCLSAINTGDMCRMDRDEPRDEQRRRLRARRAFLEDLSASRALRERVFPTRARKVRARQRYMLTYFSR